MTHTGDKIPRVHQGERVTPHLRASTFNAWSDAANAHKENQGGNVRINHRFAPPGTTLIEAANSDATVFSVNDIGGIDVSFADADLIGGYQRPRLDIVEPAVDHLGKFSVLREDCYEENLVAKAAVAGAVYVRLFVPADGAWISRADIDATDHTRLLARPEGSAQILWKSSASDNIEVDAFVRLGIPQNVQHIGVITGGNITNGSTGSMEIHMPASTATGYTITVANDWLNGGTVSNGKEAIATWFYDEQIWRLTGAECE